MEMVVSDKRMGASDKQLAVRENRGALAVVTPSTAVPSYRSQRVVRQPSEPDRSGLAATLYNILKCTAVAIPVLLAIDYGCKSGSENIPPLIIGDILIPDSSWGILYTGLCIGIGYNVPKTRDFVLGLWLIDRVASMTIFGGLVPLIGSTGSQTVYLYNNAPPWMLGVAKWIVSGFVMYQVSKACVSYGTELLTNIFSPFLRAGARVYSWHRAIEDWRHAAD